MKIERYADNLTSSTKSTLRNTNADAVRDSLYTGWVVLTSDLDPDDVNWLSTAPKIGVTPQSTSSPKTMKAIPCTGGVIEQNP